MRVQLGQVGCTVFVAFSDDAWVHMQRTTGDAIKMRWEEFAALAGGVDELPVSDGKGRHARLREGLAYFAERSGVPAPTVFGD